MANMIRVERGNVVLHVYEEEARHYLQLGYNITDDNGNVVQAAVPRDLGTLQQFYVEGSKKIKELEAQVAELQASKSSASVKSVSDDEDKAPAKRGRKPKAEAEAEETVTEKPRKKKRAAKEETVTEKPAKKTRKPMAKEEEDDIFGDDIFDEKPAKAKKGAKKKKNK